jgi:small subunit ribosomal protein S1
MSPEDAESEPQRRSSAVVTNDIGSREDLLAAIDATLKPFNEGQLVAGTIVKIDKDEVLVDIGFKSEGVIPARELSIRQDIDPRELVSVGDRIEALLLQLEDSEGRMILSKKRAQYEQAWGRIEEIRRAGGTVKGHVIEVVKGGLIVDVGLRGFLPASLVELRRVRDLQPYVGKEIECKIIELDKNRNNVVLSRRAFLEESHSVQRREFLESLQKGQVRRGTVSSIVNFGAFVDLGGVDGLVHVSELSWQHVEHPSEVVKPGQEVDVEILDVELERERVSLSLKNTQEDPWRAFARTHQPGDVVKGAITRLVPFGAFVQLTDGIEGLVHISELSDDRVELPDQVVSVGDEVMVRVIDVDLERRRISLSLKRAAEPSFTIAATEVEREVPTVADEAELVPELATVSAPAAPAAPAATGEEPQAAVPQPVASDAEISAVPEPGIESKPERDQLEEEPEDELERELPESEESLEAIVEDMKRDRT